MAYEHRDGQGTMFRNEKQNDRQPDFKGTIVIGGTTYEIAGWERTSQRGSQYISLQASLPRERPAQDGAPNQPYQQQYHQGVYKPQAAPRYEQPPVSTAAPMPSADDMPAFDAQEDLPF